MKPSISINQTMAVLVGFLIFFSSLVYIYFDQREEPKTVTTYEIIGVPLDKSLIGVYCWATKRNNEACLKRMSKGLYGLCGPQPALNPDPPCQAFIKLMEDRIRAFKE